MGVNTQFLEGRSNNLKFDCKVSKIKQKVILPKKKISGVANILSRVAKYISIPTC